MVAGWKTSLCSSHNRTRVQCTLHRKNKTSTTTRRSRRRLSVILRECRCASCVFAGGPAYPDATAADEETTRMIFTGRSVDALDEVVAAVQPVIGERRESAVSIATSWFSSLRRPGKKQKKPFQGQKQAKSAWDLSTLNPNAVSRTVGPRTLLFLFFFCFSSREEFTAAAGLVLSTPLNLRPALTTAQTELFFIAAAYLALESQLGRFFLFCGRSFGLALQSSRLSMQGFSSVCCNAYIHRGSGLLLLVESASACQRFWHFSQRENCSSLYS